MELTFNTIYPKSPDVFKGNIINLEEFSFLDPWSIGMICLKLIENKDSTNKNLLLPNSRETKQYLKRMHLDKFIQELPCNSPYYLGQFEGIDFNEYDNPNVQEILHCSFRDGFNAQLESRIRRMFRNFGMQGDDERRATALVGELGNNVFDHNEGIWPSDVGGAIIIAQNYPKKKKIEVLVADPGVGFLNSLKGVEPKPPTTDIEAIVMGLKGITGRVGEKRGNGLILVQKWTRDQSGSLRIHSGSGLVMVDRKGQKRHQVNKIPGTLAEFVVSYK